MVETFEKAGGTIIYNTTADKMIAVEGPQYAAIELKPATTVTFGREAGREAAALK